MTFIAPGTIVDRYRVEQSIGSGSMGDVVRAVDVELERTVAIKVLHHQHKDNPELQARFVREGRAAAAISHPNVVQVFTTGSYNGLPYIAMEFLEGTDLGEYVAQNGPMPSLQAAKAILDAAQGLQAAAAAGLIHRDVKPANLMRLQDGTVKVTDFGLAKPLIPGKEPALTALGVVVGTPDYIAPEQARGEDLDERVDIYALGGTLYFLLTGAPPFRRGSASEDKYLKVVARHLNEPAPNPLLQVPEMDGALARLQLRLMAKAKDKRPSYDELVGELTDIVAHLTINPRPATAPITPSPSRACSPTPFLGGKKPTPLPVQPIVDDERRKTEESQTYEPIFPRRRGLALPLTILSFLVFLAGTGLYLFGPIPKQHAESTPDAATVGKPVPIEVPTQPPVVPVVPRGMLLVPASDNQSPFFFSAKPVTHQDVAKAFPTRHKKKNKTPVVRISHSLAVAYAQKMGGRLPTKGELVRAGKVAGYKDDRYWTWLADAVTPSSRRLVGKTNGSSTKRTAVAHKDVTLRIVVDLNVP